MGRAICGRCSIWASLSAVHRPNETPVCGFICRTPEAVHCNSVRPNFVSAGIYKRQHITLEYTRSNTSPSFNSSRRPSLLTKQWVQWSYCCGRYSRLTELESPQGYPLSWELSYPQCVHANNAMLWNTPRLPPFKRLTYSTFPCVQLSNFIDV